jgi:hypothetical protein
MSRSPNIERNANVHGTRLASRCRRLRSASYMCCHANKTADKNGETNRIATCIKAVMARARCRRVLLRLLLAAEHDEPAVDAGSDSVEGATISISVSVSNMSLG